MAARPKFDLSLLREIGWKQWDPIGLRETEATRPDEYDNYLMQAARRLWDGASQEEVTDYLINIEVEHMGLGDQVGARDRAREVAGAISDYVADLR